MSLVLVEFSLINITLCCGQLSFGRTLALVELAFVDRSIRHSHLTWSMLGATQVFTIKGWSIRMLLHSVTVREALIPAAFVRNSTLLDQLSISMSFAVFELTLVHVLSD